MRRALAALAALLLAGCAQLPTTGEVHHADPQIPDAYSVDVLAEGPLEGASAQEIVEGFMRASAYGHSDDFAVAREYLTEQAASAWDPSAPVRIFTATEAPSYSAASDGGVTVTVQTRAIVDQEGRYTERESEPYSASFTLVRQTGGEWRIAALADGLLVSDRNFAQTFSSSPLYFVTADATAMVPEQRWYPLEDRMTRLVEGLLDGPSGWMRPSVTTGFPEGAELAGNGIDMIDGVANVHLTSGASVTDPFEISLMYAQAESTLAVLTDVSGVRLLVGGEELVPGTPGADLTLPASVTSPVMISAGQLQRWTGSDLQVVAGTGDLTELDPRHPAISYEGVGVPPVMLSGPDTLVTVPTETEPPGVLLEGTALLPPSIDRYGWIWTGDSANDGHLTAVDPTGAATLWVAAPWLAGRQVSHVRIAVDGARAVVVSVQEGTTRVEVAPVIRDAFSRPTSLGEPLQVGETLQSVADISWIDQTSLAVLGSELAEPAPRVHVVVIGGQSATLPPVEDAAGVASNRNSRSMVITTADGLLFVRSGNAWRQVPGVAADPAFSG